MTRGRMSPRTARQDRPNNGAKKASGIDRQAQEKIKALDFETPKQRLYDLFVTAATSSDPDECIEASNALALKDKSKGGRIKALSAYAEEIKITAKTVVSGSPTLVIGKIVQLGANKKDPSLQSGIILSEYCGQKIRAWFLEPKECQAELHNGRLYAVFCRPYRMSLEEDGTVFMMAAEVSFISGVPEEWSKEFYPASVERRKRTGGSCPYCGSTLTAISPKFMWCDHCE